MGKIAIIIEGEENKGKTSTIRQVAKRLCKEKQIEIENVTMREDDKDFCNETNKTFRTNHLDEVIKILEQQANKSKDIGLIIQFNNGIKIGIESEGDPESPNKKERLLKSLEEFNKEKEECDIILCAIRYYNGIRCDKLYEKVRETLGDKDFETEINNKKVIIPRHNEDFKIKIIDKNKEDKEKPKEELVYRNKYNMIWIENMSAYNEDIQIKCNKKSAELIYELIEKAIKELSE